MKKAVKSSGNREYENFNLELVISQSFLHGFLCNKHEQKCCKNTFLIYNTYLLVTYFPRYC